MGDGDVRGAEGRTGLDLAAALVQRKFQRYTLGLEMVGDGLGPQVQGLLVIAESQIGRAGKGLAVCQQILRRLQDAEHLVFDVQRPPAPDITVRHRAGKGGVRPVLLRTLHHRHHVLVGHVQAGPQAGIGAGNGDEDRVVADPLKAAGRHNVGVAGVHQCVELIKFSIVRQAVVRVIDRFTLDCLGQVGHRPLPVKVRVVRLPGEKIRYSFHAILSSRYRLRNSRVRASLGLPKTSWGVPCSRITP